MNMNGPRLQENENEQLLKSDKLRKQHGLVMRVFTSSAAQRVSRTGRRRWFRRQALLFAFRPAFNTQFAKESIRKLQLMHVTALVRNTSFRRRNYTFKVKHCKQKRRHLKERRVRVNLRA